jgi:glutamyl/glutaminyl-tRNA synthetase
MLNYLTTIGGGFGKQNEDKIHKFDELAQTFDMTYVNVNSCKIDFDKMKLYNRLCIQSMIDGNKIQILINDLKKLIIDQFGHNSNLNLQEDYLRHLITWSKDRIFTLNELLSSEFMFLWKIPQFTWSIKKIGSKTDIETVLNQIINLMQNYDTENETFTTQNISLKLKSIYQTYLSNVMKSSSVMKVLRLSLTNSEQGPPVAEIIELLGQQRTIEYLSSALSYLKYKL